MSTPAIGFFLSLYVVSECLFYKRSCKAKQVFTLFLFFWILLLELQQLTLEQKCVLKNYSCTWRAMQINNGVGHVFYIDPWPWINKMRWINVFILLQFLFYLFFSSLRNIFFTFLLLNAFITMYVCLLIFCCKYWQMDYISIEWKYNLYNNSRLFVFITNFMFEDSWNASTFCSLSCYS